MTLPRPPGGGMSDARSVTRLAMDLLRNHFKNIFYNLNGCAFIYAVRFVWIFTTYMNGRSMLKYVQYNMIKKI